MNRTKCQLVVLMLVIAVGGACTTLEPGPVQNADAGPALSAAGLPLGTVTIGDDRFEVEIAETTDDRVRGLMHRASLARDAGMLFAYDEPRFLTFWMRDTLIPLDIAFIDANLTIINVDQMEPMTLDLHASAGPAQYALEVNAGELQRRGIGPGDRVHIDRRP